jgi:hypothetical protein
VLPAEDTRQHQGQASMGQEGKARDMRGPHTPVLMWDFRWLRVSYLDPLAAALAPAVKLAVQSQAGGDVPAYVRSD